MSEDGHDPEDDWRESLEMARRLIDSQDTSGARVVLQRAIRHADQAWGQDDVHHIRLLRLMAESLWREHPPLDPNNASELECLQRALAIARQRLPPDDLEVARLAGEVGTGLVIAGQIDEGCALMLETIEIARKRENEEDFSRYMSGIGHARMQQGRAAEALPFFERSTLLCDRGARAPAVRAIRRYEQGQCLVALGRHPEALAQLEEALRLLDDERVQGKHARLMNDIMELIERIQ